jgi:membrane protein
MTRSSGTEGPPAAHDDKDQPPGGGAGVRAGVRRRYRESWVEDVVADLKVLDVGNAIVVFGAGMLMSVLPLMILVGALANERIDDDLSRHIGLNRHGATIVQGLFRKTPPHSATPIVLGLIVGLAGTMAVVSSLQVIYERVFDQDHRGWRDLPRFIVWVAVLFGVLIAIGSYDNPLRREFGPIVRGVVTFAVLTVFFLWTMHFLLAGRVHWRELIRAAFVTALLWLGLAIFSSFYFSSAIISEHRLYGTLGVVFILLVWFIAIGAVVMLGAACGAVWQKRVAARH